LLILLPFIPAGAAQTDYSGRVASIRDDPDVQHAIDRAEIDPPRLRGRAVGDVVSDQRGVEVHIAESIERDAVLPEVRAVLDGIELQPRQHRLNCSYEIVKVNKPI
jgi:hypothetical protein